MLTETAHLTSGQY